MRRRWFTSPALYMLITQLFGVIGWWHFSRGNVLAALMSFGSGPLTALVGVCYAIMQGNRA
jgi:hypothetical protein